MRRTLATGALLTAIVLTGCGGDDEPKATAAVDGPAGGDVIDVVAEDIKFSEEAYEATAGTVNVHYRNEGSITHTLVIEAVDGFKLEVPGGGDEDEGTVELDAGTYTLYCDVAGHRESGMEATLEVG